MAALGDGPPQEREKTMRVGIAGLGKMGTVFADRILGSGHHQLTVWNRNAEKGKPFVERGAKTAASLADLAAQSDIILTIVSDDAAVKGLYDGKDSLLSAAVAESSSST